MEHRVLSLLLATDDVRLFAFVRFTTGDAMSKRSKFALITWIGEDVSGLQRAKTGTDKTLVKEVVQSAFLVDTAVCALPGRGALVLGKHLFNPPGCFSPGQLGFNG
ncbi:hypothetical protein P7K49_036862 [Saguinus oedipus]|uniref:ADF-H domain-containing protein n=1 Tax=Saguinus oedipus TaxID=9490 RepID=A0ABQ9TLC6_SAGOE|nr:hypothetical protein P7K49_036862 [Saguinus oedipus]